ncbi:hypothetical protein O7627_30435 [Solwaraspora sp. WMMD1047]|uniref:hypothetical protein n=1 Tax=Solwaraspora sp. WMMD1047 TaxID=3016102 RepID=UPI00241754AB|nr:hypothetical protein [Solwaraspora sp. WMMD1047]MDG4833594.1 hypothetical protein [Solwaraspora sp. WMMD1047]
MANEWIGPIVTGAVGTVGISATVWLAHKQFRIQEERALNTDRRTAYGAFLKYTQQMEDCAARLRAESSLPEPTEVSITAYKDARSGATAALAEVSILGPDAVFDIAEAYLSTLVRNGLQSDRDEIVAYKAAVLQVMRAELVGKKSSSPH